MTEEASHALTPRKLTHAEARMEQRLYWAGKTVEERLAASYELTRRTLLMRGIVLEDSANDLTPSRVSRRSR